MIGAQYCCLALLVMVSSEPSMPFIFVSERFSFVFVPMGGKVEGLFPEYWPVLVYKY